MAIQGPVVRWVAHHRRHHENSDEAGDPHSPVAGEPGGWASVRAFLHAHIGWMFGDAPTMARRYAPDLCSDPFIRRLDALYPLWMVLSLGLPTAIGGILGGRSGALSGLLWGGFVRIFFVHHATWSVNSVCHRFGGQPFSTRDRSRNQAGVALITFGEGWHNNHHAFPTSARHGLLPGQIDCTAFVICALARAGWVHDVKLPTPAALAAKRRTHE